MEGGWLTGRLADVPLSAIALGTFALMCLSAVAGHFSQKLPVGLRRGRDADSSHEAALVGATLGLLALLLAFSFSMVLNRFEARRQLVTDEANAIGTAYLRTQLLDEPHRTRLSMLLIAYTENRIELSQRKNLVSESRTNDDLLTTIWAAVAASRESALAHGITTPLLTTFNEMIDLDTSRKVARQLQFPGEVLKLLLVSMIVAAGVVGHAVRSRRDWPSALILFALLAGSISVITDLNRPVSGRERESQLALIMQLHSMLESPPLVFDRFRAQQERNPGPGK